MEIRLATIEDYLIILEIYAYARKFMKENGNPTQWGDHRPDPSLIKKDIILKRMYVLLDSQQISGVFTFILGEDPTYKVIEGNWLNDEDYGVIHRIASNGKSKGVLNTALNFCEKKVSNIRIDTHEDNKVMQHLLDQRGYHYCGIIYVDDGTPRRAYQKKIE